MSKYPLKKLEIEEKITELINKMTLDEKIGQLNQLGPSPLGGFEISLKEKKQMLEAGRITKEEFEAEVSEMKWDDREDDIREGKIGSFLSIRDVKKVNRFQKIATEESRLGIPLLIGLDVVHGLRTIFPIPLAESCAWDDEVYEKSAEIAARETASMGINWTFAPMVDIARDARWGRIAEGAGEDTYLTSRFAAAKVRGFQGKDLSAPDRIVACAKHFAAYGAAEGGRDYNSANMSLQTLWDTYMPPFKAAVDAGVATIMGAFNDINGIPCTTNPYLYNEVLRNMWDYDGMVVSDSCAVSECLLHGNVETRADAAMETINAGLDMDMHSKCFIENLKDLVLAGKVSTETLDKAVRNVLRIKFAAGLFDHPFVDEALPEKVLLCKEHRAAALDAALKSIVLLKNNGVLPLSKKAKIAVIGELAESRSDMLGTWAAMGQAEDCVSLLDGLKNQGCEIIYERGFNVSGEFDGDAILKAIADADVVIAAMGETKDMSGEASSLADIGLHGRQNEAAKLIKAAGKPLVSVLFNGRPLAIEELNDTADAIVEAWHLGNEAGNAVTKVLFGDYNPTGRLTTTFPRHTGQCPLYYNHVPTGRPASAVQHSCKYYDIPVEPVFPFGFGLSYTEYDYSDLKVRVLGDKIIATVSVKNTGTVNGTETVQLYVRDKVASLVRPVKELKGFKKVELKAGEEKQVTIEVDKNTLGFYNAKMKYVVEPGSFTLWMGHDSSSSLCTEFTL
ncbi:MAG: glycosyl hydrolase [Ruminococcaceae bacterium]|nr:glycosyl hydrolase [Oscillospiraceae bacterium]